MEYLLVLDNKVTVQYNADDEEPKCSRCDFYDDCSGEACGPEFGWRNYLHTEVQDLEEKL